MVDASLTPPSHSRTSVSFNNNLLSKRHFTERQQLRLALTLSASSGDEQSPSGRFDFTYDKICSSRHDQEEIAPNNGDMAELRTVPNEPLGHHQRSSTRGQGRKPKDKRMHSIKPNPDMKKAIEKLLDISDRIPFTAVKCGSAKIWTKFDRTARACRSCSQLLNHALWFVDQLKPSFLQANWEDDGAVWKVRCQRCGSMKSSITLLDQLESNAIDWARVIGAWAAERDMTWMQSNSDGHAGWMHIWPRRAGIEVPGRSRPVSLTLRMRVPDAHALPPPTDTASFASLQQMQHMGKAYSEALEAEGSATYAEDNEDEDSGQYEDDGPLECDDRDVEECNGVVEAEVFSEDACQSDNDVCQSDNGEEEVVLWCDGGMVYSSDRSFPHLMPASLPVLGTGRVQHSSSVRSRQTSSGLRDAGQLEDMACGAFEETGSAPWIPANEDIWRRGAEDSLFHSQTLLDGGANQYSLDCP